MSPPHNLPGTVAVIDAPRAVRFDPDARAFEAFGLGASNAILDPVEATTLDAALAEITEQEHLDRGDRLGVREIGPECDLLHVYAVRRTNTVTQWRRAYDNPLARTAEAYKCRLEHICTIDLRVISGEHVELIGHPDIDERRRRKHRERQAQRPAGARR